jgi:hypothetical protein
LAERRIDEYEVEGLRGRAQIALRAHFDDLCARRAAETRELLTDRACGGDRLLDEHDLARAARQRLESERAGPREQVEAARSATICCSQLNRVSRYASGRRPQSREGRETGRAGRASCRR